MKVIGKYLILLLVAILVLSGCGKGGGNSKDATTSKTETSNHKGGVLNVALNAAPSGTLSSLLSSDASDSSVENYFNEVLIKLDKNLKNHILHLGKTLIQAKIKFSIKRELNGMMVMN